MAASTTERGSHRWRRWAIAVAVVGVAGSGALAPVTAHAVTPSADISLTLTHTPDIIVSPSTVTFTLAVHNDGPDTAVDTVAGIGLTYPFQAPTLPNGCRRAGSYDSILCDLGDIAAGATATKELALFASSSGLVTMSSAVVSDTPDPDSGDRVATDTLIVKPGPSQAVRYIRGTFPMMMQRTPDTATVNFWGARWKAEFRHYPRKMEKIPAGIMNSNEYRRLRIRESFQRILGRAPDASALNYWVNKAATGMAYETIDRRLLTSTEATHGVDSVTQLIADTYQAVLGRQPTSAESKAAFDSQCCRTFAAFVMSLQRSSEGYDVLINQRYQATFGHGPSALGRYVWQVNLRKGATPEALWAQMLVGNEVMEKYPYTDDDYRELYPEEFEEVDSVPASEVQAALAADAQDAPVAGGAAAFGG